MRFLSVAACALAASLLSAGPSKAVWVESHLNGGPYEFAVYGAIPQPIEIIVDFNWIIGGERSSPLDPGYTGATVRALVNIGSSYAFFDISEGITGFRERAWDNTITLTDEDRHITVMLEAFVSGCCLVAEDVSVGFYLPDNLSIAAPVPEPSSWALLIIGFAGIAIVRRYRPSREGTEPCKQTVSADILRTH
jgi:hypothetical protein